jgi:hypothetical protein
MERGQRLGLILAAVVVAAAAFVLLRPDGEDEGSKPASNPTLGGSPEEPTATVPAPKPQFETIRLAAGEVRGGERRIRVQKDEIARIEVRSDAPDEIHLHGYDVYKDVAPGKPARFRVKADVEGVFELEAHDLGHVIIGTLVVEP